MRFLRLILAALLAAAVLIGGFFAAAVIIVTGLVGYLVQLFLRKSGFARPGTGRASAPNRPSPLQTDDVIDVVATDVTSKRAEIEKNERMG